MEFVRDLFVKGGPVMWPLLACSVVSVTITIERALFWWRARRAAANDAWTKRILERVDRGDYEGAGRVPATGAAARVLLSGIANREHGLTASMEMAAADEIDRMKRGLGILDTIITMAPMLGILGTVTGIIESFDLLGGSGAQDPRAVTGGIAEALITTAAGLIVALATLVPFNYLAAKVQRAARRMAQTATQLEMAYKRTGNRATEQRV